MTEAVEKVSGENLLLSRIDLLNGEMLHQAAAANWDRVAEALKVRAALLSDVGAADRHSALIASRRATRKILALAQAEKRAVAEQLSSLNHGRRAADCYRDTGTK